MPLFELQKQLQSHCSQQLRLVINDNRSTMLSVKWEPKCTKVSLHRMFLTAPESVMQALGHSIAKKQTIVAPTVKAFIQQELQSLDSTKLLRRYQVDPVGKVYNLQEIYEKLNAEYFDSLLNLNITWYQNSRKSNKSQITFGLYHDALRLIKINRLMDSSFFPDYVVSYVVYHEMLHDVCPTYVDEQGIHRMHHCDFKKREKEFESYACAQDWLHKNRATFFN